MQAMNNNGEFFEMAQYNTNFYGTSLCALNSVLTSGKVPILDIDMQGVLSMKQVIMVQARAKLLSNAYASSSNGDIDGEGKVVAADAHTASTANKYPDLHPKFILVVPPGVHEVCAKYYCIQ
jgi:hypothetical protein